MEYTNYMAGGGKMWFRGGDNGGPWRAVVVIIVVLVCYFIGSLMNWLI